MNYKFAVRAQNIKPGIIRELLKLALTGTVIPFAGGNPDSSLFPLDAVKTAAQHLIENEGVKALQYGPTEGYMPLRKLIIEQRMASAGVTGLDVSNILVTTGSQQGLDLLGRALLDMGDSVICECPTYSGAVNAFRAYGCKYHDVEMDDDGIRLDLVEDILKTDKRVKLIYVIPDFQNPSGRVMSIQKRKDLLALAEKYEVPIIEDSPYSEIAFDQKMPSIKSFDKNGTVIYNGSFSKILSPGIRVAWICGDPAIIGACATLKQGTDLHTSGLDQGTVAYYMQENDLNAHIEMIKGVYKKRRDTMMNAIKECFPEDLKYTYPHGGFFTWMEFREGVDAYQVLEEGKKAGVIFVPGNGFFPNGGHENFGRLSYVTVKEESIIEGIGRLGEVLKKFY